MKKYEIEQKMSGTGSIHDIASQHYTRDVMLPEGTAAVSISIDYYGDWYTCHKSLDAARRAAKSDRRLVVVVPENGLLVDDDFCH